MCWWDWVKAVPFTEYRGVRKSESDFYEQVFGTMHICPNTCNREVCNSGAGGSIVHRPVYDGQGETTRTCKENTVLCQSSGGMFAGVRVVLP